MSLNPSEGPGKRPNPPKNLERADLFSSISSDLEGFAMDSNDLLEQKRLERASDVQVDFLDKAIRAFQVGSEYSLVLSSQFRLGEFSPDYDRLQKDFQKAFADAQDSWDGLQQDETFTGDVDDRLDLLELSFAMKKLEGLNNMV